MIEILDTRELEQRGGFDLRAELVPDFDSDDERATYGIIVRASRKGILLGESSLWNTDEVVLKGEGEDFAHGYGPGLIVEAILEATLNLAELIRDPSTKRLIEAIEKRDN